MSSAPADSSELLVSDAEREQSVSELRRHLTDGRLTVEEFTGRVEAAYSARTRGELARVLSQLPERRHDPVRNDVPERPSLLVLAARQAGYSALIVLICSLVWAFTGADGDYWPRWVILALVISFVARVGRAALGDAEARERLEQRFGGGGLVADGGSPVKKAGDGARTHDPQLGKPAQTRMVEPKPRS
jgi:DUF1707 SHOCT-like domain